MKAKALALRRYEFFWWCNILIPLAFCGAMYAVLNSDAFFTSLVQKLFGDGNARNGFFERLFVVVCIVLS